MPMDSHKPLPIPNSPKQTPHNIKQPTSELSLPPGLIKLSQQIDQFIPSFSNPDHHHINASTEFPHFVTQFFDLVEAKLNSYDSRDSPAKWSGLTDQDSAWFLQTVTRVSSLLKALLKFHSDQSYAVSINRAGRVLQRAMWYAEQEFKSILEDYSIHNSDLVPKQSTQPDKESNKNPTQESSITPPVETNFSGYSEGNISGLVKLSKALIAGGHESECCQAYFVARRNILEEKFQKLGFEKHSIEDLHKMQWESLEKEIQNWTATFLQWAKSDCPTERKLSDTVFSDNLSVSKSVFGSLSHGVTIQLFDFARAAALTKRGTEKLFKFIDIYETLRDNYPAIQKLMREEMGAELKNEDLMIRSSYGEVMISIFSDLENSIHADSGRTSVPGGAAHPLTKYTMNYLEYACEYKVTLDQVFIEHHKVKKRDDSVNKSESDSNSQAPNAENELVTKSSFQAQAIRIMDMLDANIEGKSKLYKDPSLSTIFMMNNGRCMLKKIKGSSKLKSLIGETWYRKKSSDLRLYHKDYQRESWGKLLGNLHPEGLVVKGKVSKPVLKERFKSFNAMFDEIHKTQSHWVVGDEQLQSELRVSISNMVIPAYRSFLGRYGQVFTPGRQTEKYVKFQPDDLETYIEELFDGAAGRKKQ